MHNATFYINSNLKNLLFFIEIFSAIVLLGVGIYGLIRRRKQSEKSFVYIVSFSISLVLICDVLAIQSAGMMGTLGDILSYASNYGYFFFNNLTVWSMIYYVFEIVKKNGGKINGIMHRITDIVVIFSTVMLIVNVYTGALFYFDDLNYYQRGDWFIVSQVPAILGMILLIWAIITYRKSMTSIQRLTVSSCVFLPAFAELLQVVIYGFSWLALSMDIACFFLLTQYMVARSNNQALAEGSEDKVDAKKTRTRLLVIAVVSGVFFFSAVTKITVGVATDQVQKEVNAHYDILTDGIADRASSWLEKEYQLVQSQKMSIELMDNYDRDYLTEYLKSVVEEYSEDKNIYDLYFVGIDNVMSSGCGYESDPRAFYTHRNWYTNACATKGISFTKPYEDYDGRNDYIVTLSTRIVDKKGSFRGCLALDIKIDDLCNSIMNQELPEDSYMIITDDEFIVLAYPWEGSYIAKNPNKKLYEIYGQYADIEKYINNKDDGVSNPRFEDKDGKMRSFYASKVQRSNWHVISAISSETINETERTLMESVIVALIVYLVMGVVMTLWATNGVIQKLKEARIEASAASEAKSKFLANMSHEIRTPINAVLGMDEILLRECKDDNVKEYALNIKSAGESLLGIINEVLDFSKIESGKLDIINDEYKLVDIINSTRNLIELRAKEKNLFFKIEREDYLPSKLIGDENRIRQVIVNFLTNAVKYTAKGSVVMHIGFHTTDEVHGVLTVSVKDTGMGISEEGMKALFDSFQRLDESKNRNIEGTGLGLAITKRLVELMGGTIKVESEYGKGSTFTVNIPQVVADKTNIESIEKTMQTTEVSISNDETPKYEGARVLVVDDVEMNIKVFKGLLKKTGLTIDSALSGDEAISLIDSNDYDMIFLDHMMPGKDGIETFKELKSEHSDRIKDVPVIMLTANAISGAEAEYMNEGFDGYLSKPVVRAKLLGCIEANI